MAERYAAAYGGPRHAEQREQDMTASDYFSATYQEAREKFLDANKAAGGRLASFENPNAGPRGEPLYTDVAMLGASDAKNVLVLGSGTHGVEGFAGSGIQTGLLLDGLATRLDANQRVVMIHAVNPYGFAHLRRVNEDNIDLNRNFVDHAKPYPGNPEYDRLAHAIAPRSYSSIDSALSLIRLLILRAVHGEAALQAAITHGQYAHPQGLYFGGHGETWSNQTIRTITREHLSAAHRVAFVDFHTGLGPYGDGEVILNVAKQSPAFARAVSWWGGRTKSTKAHESVSADLTGTMEFMIAKMLPDCEVTGAFLEFGTVSPIRAFRAMQAENWLHHHGGANNPRHDRIKAALVRAFYPDAVGWKDRIWAQAREVVEQALGGLRQ
jgi:hypothetical protein